MMLTAAMTLKVLLLIFSNIITLFEVIDFQNIEDYRNSTSSRCELNAIRKKVNNNLSKSLLVAE